MDTLLVFIGAGLGGVLRFWIASITYFFLGRQFPFGTLIVNVSGCFLMGLLFILTIERFNEIGPQLRSFLLIGLLGGYTTFSSFSIETINLFEAGAFISGITNILISIALCLAATWFGIIGGRQL